MNRFMFTRVWRSFPVAALACAIGACSAAPAPPNTGSAGTQTSHAETSHANRGRIRGVVTLRGNAPAQRSEPITKDQNVCGATAPVTRLTLGTDNSVRGAFVYLDGISSEEPARPRLSTAVEQKGCEYGPHVMTLTAGSNLES